MRALELDGLSFRQLRLFEAVGRVRSVHRAAEECNLSQPAVTQALTKLEESVGTRLLKRRSSGSYLNECGEILYRRVVRFLAQMEEAIRDLGELADPHVVPIVANRFSLSQVGSILAILEMGSFSRAADKLQIKSDSLQRIVRTIEKNLGTEVICSTPDGKLLTATGLEFGFRMKLALKEISWGLEEIDEALNNATKPLVIGALPFGGSVLLASVLEEFIAIHPEAHVKIANGQASELLHSLGTGNVDFVIGLEQKIDATEFRFEALGQTPYTVVARRGHPLQREGRVSRVDLLGFSWVIGTPGSHRRACFDRLFAHSRAPKAPIATCSLPIIQHLLENSDRLTLMTSYELAHDHHSLVSLPFDGIEPIPSIGISTRADWLPKNIHKDFIGLLRSRIRDMKDSGRSHDQLRAVDALQVDRQSPTAVGDWSR